MGNTIKQVKTDLLAAPIAYGFQDATRKVETVGMCVIQVTMDDGQTGIGVTYHEVGGKAIKELIDRYYVDYSQESRHIFVK